MQVGGGKQPHCVPIVNVKVTTFEVWQRERVYVC